MKREIFEKAQPLIRNMDVLTECLKTVEDGKLTIKFENYLRGTTYRFDTENMEKVFTADQNKMVKSILLLVLKQSLQTRIEECQEELDKL